MQFQPLSATVRRSILTGATAIALSVAAALPALAVPAVLVARNPRTHINVRSQPSVHARSPHYGLPGDPVEVIRTVYGKDGYRWHYVQFHHSGATGWIRADLVRVLTSYR